MRKLFMAALFIASTAPFAFAQTGDDYNKYDVGVLYSHNRQDVGIEDTDQNFLDEREGFNGVEAFVKGNVSRYVGLKGSYSFHRKSFDVSGGTAATTFDVDADLHQFLGGVDFRLSDRVDFRAVQFDYNPTRDNGQTSHNFRIGIGIIFR